MVVSLGHFYPSPKKVVGDFSLLVSQSYHFLWISSHAMGFLILMSFSVLELFVMISVALHDD